MVSGMATSKLIASLSLALAIIMQLSTKGYCEPTPGEPAQEEEKSILDESIEAILPVDEDGIRKYKAKRDRIDAALEGSPAQMRTQTRQITITPGAIPQVIRLTAGYVSTIVFQDSTGAPWPVLSSMVGSADAFQVSQPKVEQITITESQANNASNAAQAKAAASTNEQTVNLQSNMLNIVPLTKHASSNLTISLENAPYPVLVHLLTDSKDKEGRVVDSLVVFRFDKHGPKASIPQLEPTSPTTVTPELLGLLHNSPPQDATMLRVTPKIAGMAAWEYRGRIFLRTRYPAVFPAWLGVVNGDDMRVYVMPKTPSIVLSVNGAHQKFIIEGGEK